VAFDIDRTLRTTGEEGIAIKRDPNIEEVLFLVVLI
jgi:hypothetical protein